MSLGLTRSSYYYKETTESSEDQLFKRIMDEEYTKHPFYGSRRMLEVLRKKGHVINRKRVQRLMNEMGLEAVYPKPRLSSPREVEVKFPY